MFPQNKHQKLFKIFWGNPPYRISPGIPSVFFYRYFFKKFFFDSEKCLLGYVVQLFLRVFFFKNSSMSSMDNLFLPEFLQEFFNAFFWNSFQDSIGINFKDFKKIQDFGKFVGAYIVLKFLLCIWDFLENLFRKPFKLFLGSYRQFLRGNYFKNSLKKT